MDIKMEKNQGINNSDLKQRNRGLLLRLLVTKECNTRMSLAKASRLTKMSVTNIVDEFLEKKLVQEGEKNLQDSQGRNPTILEISPKAPKIVGVLINREYCAAVLCDMNLHIVKRRITVFQADVKENFSGCLFRAVDSLLEGESSLLGIGVASIGPLHVEKGMLLNPPRFFDIRDVPLKEMLEVRYGLPVYVDHQYNSAARAEKLFGRGRKFTSFIFVGITNGIGAGIYMDGKILQSANGLGSELGHMSVDYRGERCECGNHGCVENYASVNVICRRAEEILGRSVDFEECCRLSSEPAIDRIITEAVDKLSICLVGVVNLLNPEAVFLGHEGVRLPERYMARMEQYINGHKLSTGYGQLHILKASFGEEQQLAGAACNVLDRVFNGELLF